jgi:putative ATPase
MPEAGPAAKGMHTGDRPLILGPVSEGERLFETGEERRAGTPPQDAPLATRMRPRNLDELAGQVELLAPGSALRVAIESGQPHSAVFYGPPGTGKTTLARIVAEGSRGAFEELSAVNAGRAEVREVIARAEERQTAGRQTIFVLDEIHRFNTAQQDALLPAVEEGLVTLIGATTENPYFEVNSALLSRCQIYEFRPLGAGEVEALLRRALADERGLPGAPPVAEQALEMLAARSGGDARIALAALERAVDSARAGGAAEVDLAAAEDAMQRKALLFDREGDRHYDYISAWIKATRGSDPDASLYYLAVMLEGGEDPRFIARRMVIFASEDVGNADPQALMVATAAAQAVDRVGLPECALNLAQAAAYLALAPKSNASTIAISKASAHVREHGAAQPPPYLQDAHYPGAAKLGRGEGYVYPHGEPDGVSDQRLAPDALGDERFYEPTGRGFEAELGERLERLRRRRAR